MWPMVAGVGPLLGEGVIGYFIDPPGVESVWRTATAPRGTTVSRSNASTRRTG